MTSDDSRDGQSRALRAPRVELPLAPAQWQPMRDYGDDLARAGQAAEAVAPSTIFADYHQKKAQGTRDTQLRDLAIFARFLAEMGIKREATELYHDAQAWAGMNASLLVSFRRWLLYKQPPAEGEKQAHGYSIGSARRRMSTVRQYCRLANLCGAIPGDEWIRIQAVKADSRSEGANVDADRERSGIVPHIKERKLHATPVSWEEFMRLMHTTTGHPPYRKYDEILAERDTLLVCLLGEHGMRVGEVVALEIGSINLRSRVIVIRRPKTHDEDVLPLLPATQEAAELYLALLAREGEGRRARTSGPLFVSYEGKRITRQGIYQRVRELGILAGVPDLSPHDLRKFFAKNTFERGNTINVIQRYGGWRSGHMPLYYGKLYGKEVSVLKVGTEKDVTGHTS